MRYLLTLILLIFSLMTVAGLPPTTSKGNGESVYSTTFKTDYDTIPLTRSGTTITIGTIPISKGGTGSTTQNFVDLTTNQNVAGEKTLSNKLKLSEIQATGSAGVDIHNSSSAQVANFGLGGGTGISLNGTTNIGASSSDYLQVAGGSGSVSATATGSSTNVDINLVAKGSGKVNASKLSTTDSTFNINDSSDPTKQINFDASGTAGTLTTLQSSQTANRLITLPDLTTTLVGTSGAQTISDKTFVTPNLGTPSAATLTNATGLPLTTGVTGVLPEANGGTDQSTYTTGDILYASSTNNLSKLSIGSANQVLTVSGGVPSWQTKCYLLYSDQKTAGTNGGNASVTFATRTLTIENLDNCNKGTLSSNKITLASGVYIIRACSPAYKTNWHQIRWRNVTAASVVVNGESAYSGSTSDVQTKSCLEFVFTANGTDEYDIQHVAETAQATNGWGVRDATGVGGGERYTTVFLEAI